MLSKFFSNGRNVIACWLVFLAWGIFLFNFSLYPKVREYSGNADLPEETFGFSHAYFYNFVGKLGDAGKTAYFNFQLLDYINAILMGLAIFAAIYFFLKKLNAPKPLFLLLALPIISTLSDIGEDSLILYLVSGFPQKFESMVYLTTVLTNSKLIFGTLAFLSGLLCGFVTLGIGVWKKLKN